MIRYKICNRVHYADYRFRYRVSNNTDLIITILIVAAVIAVSVVTLGAAAPLAAALGGGLLASIAAGAIVGAAAGAVLGAGMSLVSQGMSNGYDNINWNEVGTSALFGAVTGAALGGMGAGLRVAIAGRAAVSTASKVATTGKGGDRLYRGLSMISNASNAGSFASQIAGWTGIIDKDTATMWSHRFALIGTITGIPAGLKTLHRFEPTKATPTYVYVKITGKSLGDIIFWPVWSLGTWWL